FGENIHDTTVARRPVALRDAMDEENVNVVGAEFFAKAVNIFAQARGIAVVGFCQHSDLVARELLDGFGNVRVTAVGVGGIEEAKAVVVVAVEQHRHKGIIAEAGLVGCPTVADSSRAHSQATGTDARFAEDNFVMSVELAGQRFGCEGGRRSNFGGEQARPNSGNSTTQKI